MSNQVQYFINNFDFENPIWDDLPAGFPDISTFGLTPNERGVLSAIKMAWFVSKNYKDIIVYTMHATINIFSFVIIFLGAISVAYYMNVEFNLGLTFLTQLFS